jgi:hypothetical protein
MSYFQVATPFPSKVIAPTDPERGRIEAGHNVFLDEAGRVWSYRGCTQFLLFYHWLNGDDIDPVVQWCQDLGVNTVRVLGMVSWPQKNVVFGPNITAGWWDELPLFVEYLALRGMRLEFVVFASAQDVMPNETDQRDHLHRVLDTIGSEWNVFIEVANEPWQNGCYPPAIFSESDHRPCPMAYGIYIFETTQNEQGTWIADLPVLDYVTVHTDRDPQAWSRKVKDLAEYRDGSGDGNASNSPLYSGAHIPCVGDEPMGAAEADHLAGRQRSNVPQDFFWAVANAAINGAGSTFHCDAGLDSVVPPPDGDQQKCAEASALAWSSIAPDFQTGHYTRGGLGDLPLVFEEHYFPEQTSRIYGRILGDMAVCVAIKPNAGWTPKAAGEWSIVKTVGPMDSLVFLVR